MSTHLDPTPAIDSDHPAIRAFAHEHARGDSVRERSVALYLAVRDRVRYDPYRIDLSPAPRWAWGMAGACPRRC